jgi:hypothetical protein
MDTAASSSHYYTLALRGILPRVMNQKDDEVKVEEVRG